MTESILQGARITSGDDALASFLVSLAVSAENRLRAALASIDEPTLAESLRVSIATLRGFATGELKMNWVICTRLAALPYI